jgi:hypothetical protein
MFGFFEKKKEKEKQLDLAFDKVAREIRSIDNWDDPKKLEHYILDSCEQIIGTTKEIEAEKAEYRKVTAYLADMKTISDLPVDKKTNLMETAKQIEALDRSRTNYQNRDPRISEEMFLQIEENEDDLPQTIRRMMDNEKYQRNIQGSMHYLEGEKSRLEVEREDTSRNRKWMKVFSILLLMVAASFLVLIFLVDSYTDMDTSWFTLLLIVLVAGFATLIFVLTSRNNSTRRKANRQLNQTISLLNSVRMRYANVTKAIIYVQEKYNIHSASELNYLWDQYHQTIREREQFMRNNDDLEYYTERYARSLEALDLKAPEMWLNMTGLVIRQEEMQESRHKLIQRRKKIRQRIEENTEVVKSERDEIDRLMREHNYYVSEIMEIIDSVDRLCGLKKKAVDQYAFDKTNA